MLDTPTATARATRTPAVPTASRRAAGLAALVAGALALAGDAYHVFVLNDRARQMDDAAYKLHGFAIMAAFVLFVLAAPALAATRGRLERVALTLATAGSILVVGDVWAEVVVVPGLTAPNPALADADIGGFHLAAVIAAYAVYAIGWLLYGIAAARRGWCPKPVAWLVTVGAVLAFLPIGGSYVLLSVGLALVGLSALRDA